MRQVEDEIKILARDEFGEELRAAEEKNLELQKENTTIKKEITTYKTKIEELRKIGNLDSPEAKKIINNLLSI